MFIYYTIYSEDRYKLVPIPIYPLSALQANRTDIPFLSYIQNVYVYGKMAIQTFLIPFLYHYFVYRMFGEYFMVNLLNSM